jgi:predicted ArsR family transcriptional regulator
VDLSEQATGVGSLADPTRRRLYQYVASRADAVGREEAARALGLPQHTANFHLDKLVEVGLLTAEYRRLSGRTGPGAGRPSKLYRRTDRQWTVSLPDRHYDLVGRILARGIEASLTGEGPLDEAVEGAATEAGLQAGREAGGRRDGLDRLAEALADHGFEPRVEGDTVLLANCPFDALAREHTALVCGLNRCFVQGVADGAGCTGVTARLDPEPDLCCVKARREA